MCDPTQHRRRRWWGTGAALVAATLVGCGQGAVGIATNPPLSGRVSEGTASSVSSGPATGAIRTVLAPLGLNLRSAPSPTAPVLGTLAQGAVVTVLAHTDDNGGWYQVRGESQTGWMSDNPAYSSSHRFTLYSSQERGFSVLFPDTWTFAEVGTQVVFRPQSGEGGIVVTLASSLDALGQPGRGGYSLVSSQSFEVYGLTGVLRRFDRSQPVASPSPGLPAPLEHLAEYRARIDAQHAIRIDVDYRQDADLQVFRDFADSMILFALTSTPSPGVAPMPSGTAMP